ncbi:MAG TPA: PQQ-binding-like beta-propeller repeat protein [Candidatus Hydrogenedentes bacterium]|nr:PQQ-binding-like beta-propeller repeat protein [Candidatus Hydrogenedentota bacterium]
MKHIFAVIAASVVAGVSAWAAPVTTGLIHHWEFTPEHLDFERAKALAGGMDITIAGPIQFDDMPAALRLDGETNQLLITENLESARLPRTQFTVESWVKVNVPEEWGAFIGVIRDNGPEESGWMLGFRDDRFCLALSTKGADDGNGKLTYLMAAKPFIGGEWHHVAGVYDGKEMRLYVDGSLSASSREQSGPVLYPEKAFFEIGAYHDDNEFFRTKGSVLAVRVYERALAEPEIAANFAEHSDLVPGVTRLALGPYLQFEGALKARIGWRTSKPAPSALEWRNGDTVERIVDEVPETEHMLEVSGLKRNTVYRYRIAVDGSAEGPATEWYACDTMFNYSVPSLPDARGSRGNGDAAARNAKVAQRIVDQTGITSGYAVILGVGDGGVACELAGRTQLNVLGVELEDEKVEAARRTLQEAGLYGPRLTLHAVESYAKLPFTKFFANLVVLDRGLMGDSPEGMADELARVLRPDGGKIFEITEEDIGGWVRVERPPLDGAGAWTHQYGTPDNSARSHDTLLGATGADQLEVQWIGRPGSRAMVDRNPRTPAPLYANGRLFTQGLQRIIAQDAYNGAILWSLEVPPFKRYNMPRDCSNWCVDGEAVYAAVEDACWRIDGAAGRISRVYPVIAPHGRWGFSWGYVANVDDVLYGSSVKDGAHYTNYWGGATSGWYDSAVGDVTHKVCSDAVFALDKASGEMRWSYGVGTILDTTITIANGRMFFVECRNKDVVAGDERRVGAPELWKDQYLVALDALTGGVVWEQPIDTEDGTVVFYLIHANGTLVIALSNQKYHLYGFNAADGTQLWHAEHDWTGQDHSGHMQHPVVVANTVFLEPCGYDLATGARVTDQMARHEGCATYAATEGALIYRGSGRRTAMWDVESGRATQWERLRPGCWLSTVAGGGMVLSPEGGGGCSCGGWLETSLAFIRREPDPRVAAAGE